MAPLSKNDFPGLEKYTWLYTGAESPLHRKVHASVNEYLQHRQTGPGGREFNGQIEASCRARFAQLLGTESQDIALLSNASEAITSILLALRLQPGENIVLHALEYPSAVLGSLALRESGVEVRVVPHKNWKVSTADILAQVDASTRLVITSHVSYLSGTRFDYQQLYTELQKTSTLLLLDATQSLGVIPVSLDGADFIVSSSYKWLLGIHGAGVLAINTRRAGGLTPVVTGWRSVADLFSAQRFETIERYSDARRFEIGFPSFPTLAALNCSLGVLLACGIDRIEASVLSLGEQLIAGLQSLGLEVMTPCERFSRAGNVAFTCSEGEQFAQKLLGSGILAWGGDGRLRFSIHGFNDEADIEHALSETQKALPK